ncbi:MAG: T9SS type A sorting domain-containing protein [Microscillaceae bacterium]|jgi:hypothetical protein|nr:T9SS type A sorting domain-containing protein [Microscillaceae bacterium]
MQKIIASQVLSDISGNATLNSGRLGSITTTDTQDPTWVSLSQVNCTVGGNFLVGGGLSEDAELLSRPAIDSLGLSGDSAQYFALKRVESNKPIDAHNIVVFPNPINNNFRVSLPNQFEGETTVELLNPSVILINRWKVIEKVSDFDLPNDISNGIYYLRISNANHNETIKVIKK